MYNSQSLNNPQTLEDNRTQCEQVREHLKAGGTLSTFDAYRLFNITCLAQRVHDLRHRYGLIIDSNPVTHNGKRFVIYSWNEDNDKNNATECAPAHDPFGGSGTSSCSASNPVTGA